MLVSGRVLLQKKHETEQIIQNCCHDRKIVVAKHFEMFVFFLGNIWVTVEKIIGALKPCKVKTYVFLEPTLPKTNSLPLKMDGWTMKVPIGARPMFRGYVGFTEGIASSFLTESLTR